MSPDDPYRAPETLVAAALPESVSAMEPAGRWRRLFNLLIDWAANWLLSLLIATPYIVYLVMQGGEEALAELEQPNLLRDYGIGLFAMVLYYVSMEGLFGTTLGKLVTGTRVVSEDGRRPSWGQVVGRTLARVIPFEPFSVLFSGEDRRGWHDSLSRTRVVRKR